MRAAYHFILAMAGLAISLSTTAAQLPEDEQLFLIQCSACHQESAAAPGTPNERAPTRAQLRQFSAEAVVTALTTGKMQQQGGLLTTEQRQVVSQYVTGKRLGAPPVNDQLVNACRAPKPMRDAAAVPGWNGHGNGPAANRFANAKSGGYHRR